MKRLVGILLVVLLLLMTVCGCNSVKTSSDIDLSDETVTSTVTATAGGETENLPQGSTSSEITTSTIISKEAADFLNENDNFGDLELLKVKEIKEAYLKQRKNMYPDTDISKIKLSDIYISEYYGTFSDGSIALNTGSEYDKVYSYDMGIVYEKPTVILEGYIYFDDYRDYDFPEIYKNSQFKSFESAYKEGVISKKIVDEFFKKYPELDCSNRFFTEKDNVSGLNKETVIKLKQQYLTYLKLEFNSKSYSDLTVGDVYITKYYKTFDNGTMGFILEHSVKDKKAITEKIGDYNYNHTIGEGLFILENLNNKYSRSLISDLTEAYSENQITDAEIKQFFEDFSNYKN